MKKAKPIKAWAVVKKGKLNANEIYYWRPEFLSDDELLVRVEIKVIPNSK